MKAVGYIRVSTQDQSLERQHEDINNFAISKGLELIEVFEDKISGSKTKTDDRGGFNRMEEFIRLNANIKHILVLEVSRLGRKNNDIQNVVERYIDKRINIHIDDLNISTLDSKGNRSFASEMMISMLGVMASNESRLLSSRIKSGKMSRARKNLAFGGKIIGYKKDKDGKPIIDKSQSPIIERIFELVSKGLGMRNVSSIIESEFSVKMATGTLGGIVRNTFHKGERKYNDLVLEVPAIVSKEVWQKANDFIDSRKKYRSSVNVNPNIIQGKIYCGCCGNVMHQKVIAKARIDTFICKDTECKNSINRPWLFRMVRKVVESHAKITKKEKVREKFKLQLVSDKAKIDLNLKEVDKLEKRKIRARELYMDLEFSKEEYREVKKDIDSNLIALEKENINLEKSIRASEETLNGEIKHFSKDLNLFKIEIQDIISHVTIYKERVTIKVFRWREYDLDKPNSTKLGWEARKDESERYKNETLPQRKPIDDDELELMINNELYGN